MNIPDLSTLINIVTACTYVVTAASFIVNLIPNHDKAEGILEKVLKVLNFLALNLGKIKKKSV